VARGHAVRGTTRDPARRAAIEAAGAEAFVGDPDRIATLTAALDHATVLCVLLGCATGPDARVAALHDTRLEMLLQRTVDSTVRGIVYEAAGTLTGPVLERGAEVVSSACEDSHIPYVLLGDPHGNTVTGPMQTMVIAQRKRGSPPRTASWAGASTGGATAACPCAPTV
jgi:uncharacterized protein YbjT (DUF2867 family)